MEEGAESYETKTELFSHQGQHHVWSIPNNIPMVRNKGGSTKLWEYFSAAETGKQVRVY